MTLYEKFDRVMQAGANKIVGGWNWTTGRTKSELANLLNIAGWASVSGGLILTGAVGYMLLPLNVCFSYGNAKLFKDIEKIEERNKDSEALDLEVISDRNLNKLSAGINLGLGITDFAYSKYLPDDERNPNRSASHLLLETGFSLMALSYYVMTAENLPPRKNCISRGLDYLVDTIRTMSPHPAYAPIQIRGNHNSFEGKIK